MSTAQGATSVPVTLPTGEPGSPVTRTGGAAAIPDESSVGATSTINVAAPGLVKDVDVRIASLTHSWVGDLAIELTSPQGTTVRLAHHPGGPDNGGNNLTGTVFNDEATTNISEGAAPYTGTFKPQDDQLSRFDGQRQQGTWTLRVRDLFEGQTGTLGGWGTTTRRAICDFGDQGPPDTSISAGPSGMTAARTASVSFVSSEGDSSFDCSLDGRPAVPCGSPHTVSGLSEGTHTFRVQARDVADNLDPTPAQRGWTVDATAPIVSLTAPRPGAALRDVQPPLAGTGGVAAGDSSTVTVKLWRGAAAAGSPAQTLTVPRDAASGAWSTRAASLGAGSWTARAEQADAAGNMGVSPAVTFTVEPVVDSTAPNFALAPVESDLSNFRANGLTVLAGCGSACRVSAELRTAGRRPRVLARASTTAAAQRSKRIKVKLVREGRAALRRVSSTKAKLRVTVNGAGPLLTLNQSISLREINLRRVARRGLTFAGKCSETCPVAAKLLMGARDARRHRLRPRGNRPVAVAGGRGILSATSSKLVLRLRKASRKRLLRARRVKLTLDASVRAPTGPSHHTSYRLTLRR